MSYLSAIKGVSVSGKNYVKNRSQQIVVDFEIK